jgi:hypothetical protein
LPSVTLGKAFAECKIAFAECIRHSAKNAIPVVYTGAKDDAMTLAFEDRGKKRLNRVLTSLVSYTLIIAIPHESRERKEKLLLQPFLLCRRAKRSRF